MSYKDGIPLLHPFEDGDDDDDDDVLVETSTRRVRCRKRHICLGVVLALAVLIIIGIAAGVTVPLVFLQHSNGGTTGGVQGVNQTESSSYMTVELTSMPMTTSPTVASTGSTQSQSASTRHTQTRSSTQSQGMTMPTTSVAVPTQPSSSATMATQPSSSVPVMAQSSLPAHPPLPSVITQRGSSLPTLALTSSPSLSSSMTTPAGSSALVITQSSSSVPQFSFVAMTTQASSSVVTPAQPTLTIHPSPSVAVANNRSTSSLATSHMTMSMMSPLNSPSPSISSPLPTQMPTSQLVTTQLQGSPSLSATTSLAPALVSATSHERIIPTAMLSPSPSQPLVYITSVSSHMPSPTATPTMTPLPQSVEKSARDNRTYQVLYLENQLRVLLISDPDSNISAAAMEVAVGSFSDPPEVQGLAHFCEHMLFLGTQKYPNEHAYSNFLSTHGGYDNAFTFMQETNYFFSVEAEYLEHALDMFAQFFIAPLFTPGAVANESHAVNAEYEKNLQSDEWRLWQLLKHVSNPAHPFSGFSIGNLQTLNNPNILDHLHNYYDTHYSADQMQLVIYGRDPIENMTLWANEYFSPIINRGVSAPTFNTTSFPPGYNGTIVHYYTVADKNTLHIYWQTPPLQYKYRNAISQFLTRYIGHEGEGSILWKLRNKRWATSLSAGTEIDTDSYTLLFVSIDITNDGLPHISEVISVVFEYIRLLQRNLKMQEWDDFVRVKQLKFDYAERDKPSDYAVTISEAMRVVTDPADFLATPYRFLFNFTLVTDTLNYLTPDNSVVFIGTQKLSFNGSSHPTVTQVGDEPVPWPVLTQYEPIYGIPYQETNLSAALVEYWQNDRDASGDLHLPGTNQFIPDDLEVLELPVNASNTPVEVPIDDLPGVSLWWLQDTEFHEPHVYLHCNLNTSHAETTAEWSAKSQLFVSLVNEVLQSKVYAAKEVGYSYSLSPSPNGLTLSFSGLSDPAIFRKFISTVAGALTDTATLRGSYNFYHLANDSITDYLRNYNLTTPPYRYYQYIQSVVLERPYWRHWELLSGLAGLDVDHIVQFADNLLSDVTLLCFAHGNLNQSQAVNYTHTLASPLSSKLTPSHPVGHFLRRRVNLSPGANYSIVIPALNPEDVNSVVNVLFQVGNVCHLVQLDEPGIQACSVDSLRRSVHLGLLNQIIGEQCFYHLRTIQQLGYIVFCHNRVNEGVGSFEVVVQSQEYEPGEVLKRIDSFLESFEDYLSQNITGEEWERQVEVYRAALQRRDLTLAVKSSRLWEQINNGQLQFDYNEEAAGVLGSISSVTLLQFYQHNIVDTTSYKKMVFVAYAQDKNGSIVNIENPLDYTQLNQTALQPLPPLATCESGMVNKSTIDDRTYQVLCLDNQLQVLLISDPNSNISAAAMDVAVGSFSDPPEVQGLAHFCEHMLFLGTQKYPSEHAYSNFLSTHGGYDNAFTSTQETDYYFSVEADYLEHALDMFAQFFIAPLFTPGAVTNESHAVNAEHEKNLQSDEWRLWQLLKHVSNPTHPFSGFSTGNLQTLNNSNILKYLHDYYNTHYSANQMQLVIYGRDPIQNLILWASEYFSPIINHGVSAPTFNTTSFPPGYNGKIVHYYTVADKNTLHIYWQTPPLQYKYRNAISQFLTRYIGHEGEGSILWSLKNNRLATSLSAGMEVNTDSYTLLFVSIDITDDGLPHISGVIETVFEYIRLLQRNLKMQEWDDFVRVNQLKFDYAERDKPSDYAVTISEAMRVVTDPADFLATPYRFLFNFTLVNDTLNYLTPDNSVVFIGTQKLNFNGSSHSTVTQESLVPVPWPVLTQYEPIYGTPYQETNLSAALVEYWQNNRDVSGDLHLPGTNQFIPEDLKLLKSPVNASNTPMEVPTDDLPGVSLWWLQDTEFHEPHVYLHCNLNTSHAETTAEWSAKSLLFVSLVNEVLQSKVYAAKEVGYSYSLSPSPNGLTLSFSGLSDPAIFRKFISTVAGVLTDTATLQGSYKFYYLANDSITEYLRNYNLTTPPYHYYQYIQSVVLEQPYWRHWELLSEMKTLDLDQIVQFADNLLSDITLLCFAHGNLDQSEAVNYTRTLASPLSSKLTPSHPVGHFLRRRINLSPGANYSIVIPVLNPEDVNSVVNVLFQVGSVCHLVQSNEPGTQACSLDTLRTSVLLGLLNQVIGEQCFYHLRTIQQLGYVAFCRNRVNEGVGSFEVVVQSQEYEPGEVLKRIDSFLGSFEDYLSQNITGEEWERQVEVYRAALQRRDLTLVDKSSRLWEQISNGQLQFDYNEEAAGVLDSINSVSLLEFYQHNIVDTTSYKKMVFVAYAHDKNGSIVDIENPLDYTQLNQTALQPLPPLATCESGMVNKSTMDNRTYQVLCLDNQLRVLLISDPDSNISAAAMDVAVGSFSDPPQVQGLAHFCEHMLFLGTQKYPNEHVYSNFLSTHGGYDNAFTSTQETDYYFSVEADYFEHALDMFAQFFIAPLFTPGAVANESHAVNAEHEKNLQSDEWRLWQLLKHVSTPAHPFSGFSTGNLQTLNNSNILNYLYNYYYTHYSANQMQLVMYGRDPIENMTLWANEYFSPIINRGVSAPTFNTTSFPPGYNGTIVHYYTVADKNTLHIYWQTPPLQYKYRNAISQFLTRYIGHEGEGSILLKLRNKRWATSLSAGTEIDTDSYTLLFVSIDVTNDGLPHISEVISVVFQYIRLLQRNLKMQEWDDFVRVKQLKFDYDERDKPSDYAVTISEAMRLATDPADFLATPYRFLFNSTLVTDTLNYLTPDNCVVFIGTQKLNFNGSSHPTVTQVGDEPVPWPELTQYEPIYGTLYQETNLSTPLIEYWRNDRDDSSGLHLPGTNQFIPEDLEVLEPPVNASNTPMEVPTDDLPGVSLWWLQDTEFHEPHVYLHCNLNTSHAETTAEWSAKTLLFVSLVNEVLQSKVYAAKEVGYSYSLSPSPNGLTLSFSGLRDPAIFRKFISTVAGALTDTATLRGSYNFYYLANDSITDYLRNYNLTTPPYRYYQYIQSVVLERPYWRHWELLSELAGLDVDHIVQFADNLLSDVTVLCFAHGNLNQSQAVNYTHTLASPLSSKLSLSHPVGHFSRKRVNLSPGANYSIVIPALNPEDVNSVVNVLFQVGNVCHLVPSNESGTHSCSLDSLRTSVLLGLLSQIMGDQCFYQLRTVQQLGYVAFCRNRVNEGVGSFEVVVQSQEYEPQEVLKRIDSFLESFEDYLSGSVTGEEWERQVEVYRATLQRRDLTLTVKSSRLWEQISNGQLQFDYNGEAAGVLDSINSATLLEFYQDNIIDLTSYKKMVIIAYGHDKSGNLTSIENPLDYTQQNFL